MLVLTLVEFKLQPVGGVGEVLDEAAVGGGRSVSAGGGLGLGS